MNIFKRLLNYVKDSITELKKVTWPTNKTTLHLTALVVIIGITFMVFLSLLDFVFNIGLEKLLSL